MNTEIIDKLSLLGLTEKQVKVYVASLELGASSVGSIALRSGQKRTTAYAALQELIRLELCKAVKSGNKYIFTPEEPGRIVTALQDKALMLKAIVPMLNAAMREGGVEPKIDMYHGVQLTKLFDKMLLCRKKELFMIRTNAKKSEVIGREFHFGEDRRNKGIFAKVLLPRDTPKLKHDANYFRNQKQRMREVRLLPTDLEITSDMFLFDETICSIMPSERFGFSITSKDFSIFWRNIFNLLWDLSAPTYSL